MTKTKKPSRTVDARLAEAAEGTGLIPVVSEKFGFITLYRGSPNGADIVAEAFWAAKGYKDRRTTKRSDAFEFLIRAIVGIKF